MLEDVTYLNCWQGVEGSSDQSEQQLQHGLHFWNQGLKMDPIEEEGSSVASEEVPDEDVVEEDEGEGEDLIGEGMARDYRAIPQLDSYDEDGVDVNFVDDCTPLEALKQRRAAERALDQRDRRTQHRSQADALYEDEDGEDSLGRPDFDRPTRRRRVHDAQFADLPEQEGEEQVMINLEDVRGKQADWIRQDRIKEEIGARFRKFLRQFREDGGGEYVYRERLWRMIKESRRSLEVEYIQLGRWPGTRQIAVFLIDDPQPVLPILNDVASQLAKERLEEFETNWGGDVSVRVVNVPHEERIRDLKAEFLNTLVTVRGVVTRRTGVFPQLRMVTYDCTKCGGLQGPYAQNGDHEVKPFKCSLCQSKGPFVVNQVETVYSNYQRLTIQESPGTVPSGRLPRAKGVILTQDLIDAARPGDEIVLTGIYTHTFDSTLNKKSGFPVFTTQIEANSVKRNEDIFSFHSLTEDDMKDIRKLAKDHRVAERISSSIAPSIHGHDYIKMAIALALFGGVEKSEGVHKIRGDINVLLLGDPGVGKSQFLKYTEQTAQRCVYTTGKGASAVGLTASVQKDAVTKEWTLEGGALVLADRGVCLIDEFDKMDDQDRVSIHEAMEQQSISISKAGIIAELHARCTVIAAANPIGGRYDPRRSFRDNVNLEDPILSRFDCLCVIRDVVDVIQDGYLADFVVSSHMKSHPNTNVLDEVQEAFNRQQKSQGGDTEEIDMTQGAADGETAAPYDPDIISQDLLRKYLVYAKMNIHPRLQQEKDLAKITEVYNILRREASFSHGINITVRHLESMVRMSEAHAKMHLRNVVLPEDIDVGVRMMVESFITTQKLGIQKDLRRRLRRYLVCGQSSNALMVAALRDMVNQRANDIRITGFEGALDYITIPLDVAQHKAEQIKVNWSGFLSSKEFTKSSFILDESGGGALKVSWMSTGL